MLSLKKIAEEAHLIEENRKKLSEGKSNIILKNKIYHIIRLLNEKNIKAALEELESVLELLS